MITPLVPSIRQHPDYYQSMMDHDIVTEVIRNDLLGYKYDRDSNFILRFIRYIRNNYSMDNCICNVVNSNNLNQVRWDMSDDNERLINHINRIIHTELHKQFQ